MTTRDYEAMFILENNAATADFEGTSGQVDAILEKHGATIVQKEKWDERKLAYEIKGQRRGTYYLTYFNAEPDAIGKINEDVHLNETILRHMVLTLEVPVDEHIETQATEREKLAEDSRKNSLGGWGGGRRDRRGPPPRKRDEPKPAEGAKPVEGKPAEAQPAETKPAEATPAEAAKAETKPAEAAKEETKPAEAATEETKPATTEAASES